MEMQDITALLGGQDPVQMVTDGILAVLEQHFPSWPRFTDKIRVGQPKQFFVELFRPSNRSEGARFVDRSLQVDIVAYADGMTREQYLTLAAALDKVFLPVLRFGARAITIEKSNAEVVEDMLHYTFGVSYRDGTAEPAAPTMETLHIKQQGGYICR